VDTKYPGKIDRSGNKYPISRILHETSWNVGTLEYWNIGLKIGIGQFLYLN
jgi:hypothetical protein